MERPPDFNSGDELTQLFWQIAETCGSIGPDSAAVAARPEQPRGTILSPEDQAAMVLDEEYYEQRVACVERQEDGKLSIVAVRPDDNEEASPCRYTHESLDADPPEVGETIRFYGLPYETIRGVVVGDRTYFYTPRIATGIDFDTELPSSLLERGNNGDEAQLEFGWRAEALPWPLKKVVLRTSRKDPNGCINGGALLRAENAARIVDYFNGDAEAIRKFIAASPAERLACEKEIGVTGSSTDSLVAECRVALWCISHTGWNLEIE